MSSTQSQKGLIMVKPHAIEAGLDSLVEEILQGQGLATILTADDPLRTKLEDLTLGSLVHRNLREDPHGFDVIQLFYDDKSDRRYYPLILERYVGEVAFLPFLSEGDPAELGELNDSIKGATETYDVNGTIIDPPSGVRGLLGEPYLFIDRATSELMDDETYREHFSPVIDNFIHVCDKPGEVEQAAGMMAIDIVQ